MMGYFFRKINLLVVEGYQVREENVIEDFRKIYYDKEGKGGKIRLWWWL